MVLGISGGLDSMAMLYACNRISIRLNIVLYIAHVNHGLRPEESLLEEALVREYATRLNLPCLVGRLAVKDLAQAKGLSIEQAARQLRYEFFEEVRLKYEANKIAVAHNSDDQAEEVLLRLIRGTGRKGLSGMEIVRENKIIRPLLTISRERIAQYLRDENIDFRIDSSNMDRRYTRNRVRLDLLPQLAAKFNPRIKQTLCQTAKVLQDEERMLAGLTVRAYERVVTKDRDSQGERRLKINLAQWRELDVAIKRRLLESAILAMGRKPAFRQIEALLQAADRSQYVVHLAGGLRAYRDDEYLSLAFPAGQTNLRQDFVDLAPVKCEISIPTFGVYVIPEINIVLDIEILQQTLGLDELKKQEADFLDYAKLSFPLRVRTRQSGDRYRPMGSTGSKKVGDFLTDLKIPHYQRRLTPILVSGDQIAALLGLRVGHDFRVTSTTQKILKITIKHKELYEFT